MAGSATVTYLPSDIYSLKNNELSKQKVEVISNIFRSAAPSKKGGRKHKQEPWWMTNLPENAPFTLGDIKEAENYIKENGITIDEYTKKVNENSCSSADRANESKFIEMFKENRKQAEAAGSPPHAMRVVPGEDSVCDVTARKPYGGYRAAPPPPGFEYPAVAEPCAIGSFGNGGVHYLPPMGVSARYAGTCDDMASMSDMKMFDREHGNESEPVITAAEFEARLLKRDLVSAAQAAGLDPSQYTPAYLEKLNSNAFMLIKKLMASAGEFNVHNLARIVKVLKIALADSAKFNRPRHRILLEFAIARVHLLQRELEEQGGLSMYNNGHQETPSYGMRMKDMQVHGGSPPGLSVLDMPRVIPPEMHCGMPVEMPRCVPRGLPHMDPLSMDMGQPLHRNMYGGLMERKPQTVGRAGESQVKMVPDFMLHKDLPDGGPLEEMMPGFSSPGRKTQGSTSFRKQCLMHHQTSGAATPVSKQNSAPTPVAVPGNVCTNIPPGLHHRSQNPSMPNSNWFGRPEPVKSSDEQWPVFEKLVTRLAIMNKTGMNEEERNQRMATISYYLQKALKEQPVEGATSVETQRAIFKKLLSQMQK